MGEGDIGFEFDTPVYVVDETTNSGESANSSAVPYASDVLVSGSVNQPPVISDQPESSTNSPFGGITQLLGSIGTTARDLGTAVGTAKASIKGAGAAYRTAEHNAATGNSVGQWWQYSTTMDKVMVGLAVAVVAVILLRR
jgi:hypothetical protein